MVEIVRDEIPASPPDPASAKRNARVGLALFCVYTVVYAAFIWLNAFRPDWMEVKPLAGLNLAVVYGFGLIVGAFVLSLVYGWLCRKPHFPPTGAEDEG